MKISQLTRCYIHSAFHHHGVNGSVMDRLQGPHSLEELTSKGYLTRGHVGLDCDGGCTEDNGRNRGGTPVRTFGPYKLK